MVARVMLAVACCLMPAIGPRQVAADDEVVADTIIAHQRGNGGWPKHYDRTKRLDDASRAQVAVDRGARDTTIDNGATYRDIRLLATCDGPDRDPRIAAAVQRGIEYLLAGQYPAGGWPQRFPDAEGYPTQITFNDDATVGVLELLHDVATGRPEFSCVPAAIRDRCRESVRRGIDCILACQIVIDGRRTVWCAQHDRETLRPCGARSFELPSLSGSESVGIVRFLMRIDRPSPDVIAAVEAAAAWFERARIEGLELRRVPAADTPRGYDVCLVPAPGNRDLWARFYDLETGEPFVCGRDGVPTSTLADIPYERRVGYSWYGPYAKRLLDEELPGWRDRVGR